MLRSPIVPRAALLAALLAIIVAAPARAGLTEPRHLVPGGGGVMSRGGAYVLSGAAADPSAGTGLSAGAYHLVGGFWAQPDAGLLATPDEPLPESFELSAVKPNPFSDAAALTLALPTREHVSAEVFGLGGQRVAVLLHGTADAGVHHLVWNGETADDRPAPAGVYFLRVRAGAYQATRRVVRVQ